MRVVKVTVTSKPMAALFDSYVEAVYGRAPLHPDQQREVERAFYAGAKGVIDLIMQNADPGVAETQHDLDIMDVIYRELEAFGDAVMHDIRTEGNA